MLTYNVVYTTRFRITFIKFLTGKDIKGVIRSRKWKDTIQWPNRNKSRRQTTIENKLHRTLLKRE